MLSRLGINHLTIFGAPTVLDFDLLLLMIALQAAFMVFLSIQYTLGKHGGGVHQWNTAYEDVQYNHQVSMRTADGYAVIIVDEI